MIDCLFANFHFLKLLLIYKKCFNKKIVHKTNSHRKLVPSQSDGIRSMLHHQLDRFSNSTLRKRAFRLSDSILRPFERVIHVEDPTRRYHLRIWKSSTYLYPSSAFCPTLRDFHGLKYRIIYRTDWIYLIIGGFPQMECCVCERRICIRENMRRFEYGTCSVVVCFAWSIPFDLTRLYRKRNKTRNGPQKSSIMVLQDIKGPRQTMRNVCFGETSASPEGNAKILCRSIWFAWENLAENI